MSLLLDARRKSQAAQGGDGSRLGESSNAASPASLASRGAAHSAPSASDSARVAGQNLFSAKSAGVSPEFAGINRNLLLAMAGTALFLAAGGGYVWYVTSAGSNEPVRTVVRAPAAAPIVQPPPAAEAPPKSAAPSVAEPSKPAAKRPMRTARSSARMPPQQTNGSAPLNIERHQADTIDPLLNSAYLAYRDGKFEQAQQLYLEALKLDGRNTDALLGLAAIAQRRGADGVAVHYYAKVLELDPRDAVANAGMSALTTSSNVETRLKILLNEQPDSSSLHFALGNFYATQERWGEAQKAYFQACTLAPENAGLAFHLAISLEHLGQKKLAAQYYQSALQLDVSQSEGFDHAKISQRIEALSR